MVGDDQLARAPQALAALDAQIHHPGQHHEGEEEAEQPGIGPPRALAAAQGVARQHQQERQDQQAKDQGAAAEHHEVERRGKQAVAVVQAAAHPRASARQCQARPA